MTEPCGRLEGGDHEIELRVYYQDTDAGGIVYHANYLAFAERGRNEMIRALGFDCKRLRNDFGMIFVVREAAMDFRRPAYLDDLLQVRTRVVGVGGASLEIVQRVLRGSEELTTLRLRIACVSLEGKPLRMPVPFRRRVEEVFTLKG